MLSNLALVIRPPCMLTLCSLLQHNYNLLTKLPCESKRTEEHIQSYRVIVKQCYCQKLYFILLKDLCSFEGLYSKWQQTGPLSKMKSFLLSQLHLWNNYHKNYNAYIGCLATHQPACAFVWTCVARNCMSLLNISLA